MDRRKFGRLVLQAAALQGLRSISAYRVATMGAAIAGCADRGRSEGRPDILRDLGSDGGAGGEPCDDKPSEVVIVGSGYGAAVTALRLTEASIPVTMLEMGRLWNTPSPDGKIFCGGFSPDGRAMWFKDKFEAVFKNLGPFEIAFDVPKQAGIVDALGPEDMRVFVGRGVGGGSLVNMSIYVTPLREVFERVFPRVDAGAMFGVYYPRAKQNLQASMVPEAIVRADCYQYSRVGIAAAEAIGIRCDRCESGYDYAYMQREIDDQVPRSALGGEALFGNNYGKRSLDKTYLAEAMGTGLLTIHALHQVTRVTRASSGEYVVHAKEIDILGNTKAEKQFPCKYLFLGGGSMGTSELLVRARERGDLPELSAAVGTEWGPNSDIFVARQTPLWEPTGDLQATVPSSSFRTRDQDGKHVFSMIIPMPAGIETWLALNVVMTENPESGYFTYDSVSDSVSLHWHVSQNDPSVRSARFVFDAINRATGSVYAPGMFAGGDIGAQGTYHPVGGCSLGKATDDFGRLTPYRGLYVMDGSLIPVGIGANPALTITALAERNIERILAEDLSR